jgi:hypothetical protein
MSRKNRTTKDNVGIVYLFTNKLYERENLYKYGITINPFQRKRVQSNSTPPTYPFYDRIVMFSKSYKEIEKRLTKIFDEKIDGKKILLENKKKELFPGQKGGQEWVKAELSLLVDIYKGLLKEFPDAQMCYQGKRYKFENGKIRVMKLPNCNLEFLGILDGDTIKCTINHKVFKVQNNGILDSDGQEKKLSGYVKTIVKREGCTNEWAGFMYFEYKGHNIYNMWQSLLNPEEG